MLQRKKENKDKYLTLKDLGNFTEEVIFPGVERIVEGKIDKLGDRLGAKLEQKMENKFTVLENRLEAKLEQKMEDKFVEFKEVVVREISQTVMESNDKLATKIDVLAKELAAHGASHHRMDIVLHDHEKRIKKLEIAK
ncbi:MAG: hypothetical protein Q8R29_02610 [bacterium]|nr:hypothetical protein [bacterium]